MSEKERDRDKAGLHKKISSIFSGVLIPQKNNGRMSSSIVTPEDTETESVETQQQAPEALESESQNTQIIPEVEPAQESRPEPVQEAKDKPVSSPKFMTAQESNVVPIEESEIESSEDSQDELIQETNVEPVQESKAEQADTPKFVTAQESKVIPIEESEIELSENSEDEPVQEPKAEQADTPKFVTAQESNVVPIEESEIESSKDFEAESVQEPKAEQADTPRFVTAQESKVIPIEESEIESSENSEDEPVQEPKAEQTNTPRFVTAQESKVIPIEESELESAQESENEPTRQSKFKKDKKPKVIPVKEPKKADVQNIAQKVTKKSSVVKVSDQSSWRQITSKLFEAKSGTSPTKQKAMVVMMPALFIILIVFVIRGGVFGTSGHNAQTGDEINNVGVASLGLNDRIDWEIPEPYPTTLRDPMQLGPVVAETNQAEIKELGQLVVKSILYSEDYSSAIISNCIVHEGDQIQGASITKIEKDSVEFEMNGKKWSQGIQR